MCEKRNLGGLGRREGLEAVPMVGGGGALRYLYLSVGGRDKQLLPRIQVEII